MALPEAVQARLIKCCVPNRAQHRTLGSGLIHNHPAEALFHGLTGPKEMSLSPVRKSTDSQVFVRTLSDLCLTKSTDEDGHMLD